MLSDAQWSRIENLLPGKPTDKGGRAADNRRFVEAVLYTARVGNPWRDLPAEFGNWHSVYVRFARWETYGVWNRVAESLCGDALIETIETSGAQAIIPPRSNRTIQGKVDWHRYKARNLVEPFFNRLKQFRRLATRYDKLANRFNAFLHLACAYIWLL
jgi:transposase